MLTPTCSSYFLDVIGTVPRLYWCTALASIATVIITSPDSGPVTTLLYTPWITSVRATPSKSLQESSKADRNADSIRCSVFLPAHGKSQGEQEYVQAVQNLVDDVYTFSQVVHQKHAFIPRLLLGHSLGGLISLMLTIQHPDLFHYVILSAPVAGRPPNVSAMLHMAGSLVAKITPRLRLTPLDTSTLCRDPEVGTFP